MSKGPDANTPPHAEFESLLLIAHYYANRSAFQPHKSLEELATKIAISLLRHTDIIPADKAFYEAGMMCRVIIYMHMILQNLSFGNLDVTFLAHWM